MQKTLDRVLQIRLLLEDTSQLELNERVQSLLRLENAIANEQRVLRKHREELLEILVASFDADRDARFFMEVAMSVGVQREKQLKMLALAETGKVREAREKLLTRRKERQQIDVILHADMEARARESARREQRNLDEWFSQQRIQAGRNEDRQFSSDL